MSMEDSLTHKNILAVRNHSETTRKIARELEKKVQDLTNENQTMKGEIAQLRSQVAAALAMRGHGATTR